MKNNLSAITLSSLILTTSLISPMAAATQNSTDNTNEQYSNEQLSENETIGISVGAIIGGIFGGPPGAFITALAGDFIAKNFDAEQEIEQLQTSVANSESNLQLATIEHKQEVKTIEQQFQQEMLNLAASYRDSEDAQVENILMSLLFRTGSSDIEPHYQQQVIALAKVLKRSEQMMIDLSGYTDKQGDEQLNSQLAIARVASVKQLLIDNGIDEQRIISNSFGELAPIDAAIASEVNYFDRRVEMKLITEKVEVAQTHQ